MFYNIYYPAKPVQGSMTVEGTSTNYGCEEHTALSGIMMLSDVWYVCYNLWKSLDAVSIEPYCNVCN